MADEISEILQNKTAIPTNLPPAVACLSDKELIEKLVDTGLICRSIKITNRECYVKTRNANAPKI